MSNLSSLTKAPLFLLEDGQTVLGTAHSKLGGPTFVNEVVHKLEKK